MKNVEFSITPGARQVVRRSAFTLVELLVVIAIIGLLAGVLLTAVMKARVAAKRTEARDATHQLVTAWKSYLVDYRRFPAEDFGTVNELMMKILNARDEGTNANYNVRVLKYFEFSGEEWVNLEYRDPWGTVYRVALDNGECIHDNGLGYDETVKPHGVEVRRSVAAWSFGQDKVGNTIDDITSW